MMIELLIAEVLVIFGLCWLARSLGLVEDAIGWYYEWKVKQAIRKILMEGEKLGPFSVGYEQPLRELPLPDEGDDPVGIHARHRAYPTR